MSDENTSSYLIEKILQEEVIDGKPHYLIKWKGYSATQSTWEPIQNLLEEIDIVHKWKSKHSTHSKKTKREPAKKGPKTKKICYEEKGHCKTDKKIQSRLNQAKKQRKKIIDSIIIEEEQSTGFSDYGNKNLRNMQQSSSSTPITDYPHRRIQQMRRSSIFQSESPSSSLEIDHWEKKKQRKKKKSRDQYFSRFEKTKSRDKNRWESQEKVQEVEVEGFRVVGKITGEGIKKVVWCFEWQGQKICEVELVNGKKANMRREDVQRLCPDKLCEYLQKVVDFRNKK